MERFATAICITFEIYREMAKSALTIRADFVVSNLTVRRNLLKERGFQVVAMKNVILSGVTRCDQDETELEFIVRGHKVAGLFPATPKSGVYHSIKSILIDTYIGNNFVENMQKI